MSNRKHSKPGEQPSKTPPTLPDTPSDDPLRVSSLKPTSSGFSQRRLLNVASVAVVVIALLALAIHWLPDALPRQPSAQPTRAAQTRNTPTPPIRGAGWKRSGPDWAQSIAFSSTAELGYACGASGAGNTPIFFAVYHVEQNSWSNPTRPASGADCRVVASPFSGSEMALIVGNCSGCATTSHVYRSHDDGRTWSQARLPASFVALDLAWTTSGLFMTATDTSTQIYNAHLLSVHDNGSYTELTLPTAEAGGFLGCSLLTRRTDPV